MSRLLLSLLVLAMTLPAAGQAPPGFDAAWSAYRDDFTARLQAHGVVGGSVLVLHDGDVLGWATYGLADRDAQRPVDRATIYHWASVTKTLTGVAIMQLRDRGLLRLDDPVVDYLPELRAVHDPHGDVRDVTIRHVMSHSAGFRSPTWPWGGDQPWHPHEPAAWSQLVAMIPYTEVEFPPGSRFQYSNLAILFLGQIIERLTGDDYEVYVDKNLFKPLGMHRSYFDHTPYHLLGHRSNNYYVQDGEATANGLDFDTGITVSNGGLNAPLGDMARYLGFLTGSSDPERQAAYDSVLARSSLKEMWAPQHDAGTFGDYRQRIALTFFVMDRGGFRAVGHTGSQKGFRAFFYVDPATRAAAIGAVNTAGPDADALRWALSEQLFETIFPCFSP